MSLRKAKDKTSLFQTGNFGEFFRAVRMSPSAGIFLYCSITEYEKILTE